MLKRVLFLLFIGLSGISLAQTGNISGSVIDTDTNEPLIGATILIKGTNKGSISDLNGQYLVKAVPAGKQTVLITYIGYEEVEQEIEVLADQTTEVPQVSMTSTVVGLKEVEIFASVVEDRKTPVAVSAINALEIDERFVGTDVADIVQNTPGVYTIQGAGGYGDQEVYIRGFDQSNIAFLVNGIPVNDMENGRMFWSNFAGLSEVTRQLQVQRGLGASKLAISSIGGTVNMITKPAERSEGGRIEYQTGTGSWNQRLRFTYNTGLLDGGWAVSFQGSRTTTDGGLAGLSSQEQGSVIPGAFTDAWSYYLSVSKKINDQHSLMFWGFGAPVNRGTAWVVDEATREKFNIDEPNASNSIGIYQGELFNHRQNKIHKPLMALTHFWDKDRNTSLTTSFYASFADVYSTQPVDQQESLFLNDRTPGNPELTGVNLINWDYLAQQNRADDRFREIQFPNGDFNTPLLEGYESRYFIESRHNNHKWYGLISNFKKSLGNLNLLGGVDLRYYRGQHFGRANNLIGGDFVLNRSERFDDDYNKLITSTVINAPDNAENIYGAVVREGDKYRYDYEGVVTWGALFAQAEYTINKTTVFATISGTQTSYKRIGYMWNARPAFNDNSLGESSTKSFLTYTAKIGASYRPTNRHQFFANAGRFTRPPFFDNAFIDSRYSNNYNPALKLEDVNSVEGGYTYNTSKIRASVNYYLTYWNNRTTTSAFNSGDNDAGGNPIDLIPGDLTPTIFNGLISRHEGVELDFKYNVTSSLELNGFVSYGDWKWDNNTTTTTTFVTESGNEQTATSQINLKGLSVGASAQTAVGIGAHYKGIRDTYIGARWNYFDRISVRYSPEDAETNPNNDEIPFVTADQINDAFPAYSTLQIYAGRYFDVSDKIRGRLSASVQNVLNEKYVRWSSYFSQQYQNAYGYPRTYTISLSFDF
ncbi:TonB-dependent receptor [Fulvivirga lutea]|uniref:TonB-dependent receptor n=1 Tax=Fulvivirga lutea TaxID=2810512 RepID=A0A975A021_9BACT|nr:TonB-dependent receptor [Fulvivirga lutea]QSE96356.1 TonB-dependent receptor [Fulvivirga lutea]